MCSKALFDKRWVRQLGFSHNLFIGFIIHSRELEAPTNPQQLTEDITLSKGTETYDALCSGLDFNYKSESRFLSDVISCPFNDHRFQTLQGNK